MGIARIEISYVSIIDLLKLPEGTEILMTTDRGKAVQLVLTHPDLAPVGADSIPLIKPVFATTSIVTRMLSWRPQDEAG